MAKKRTRSIVLDRASARAAAISTIGANVKLGGKLSIEAYQADIAVTQAKLLELNTLLTAADNARREFARSERYLADMSDRMLAGVGALYGKDSVEYVKAGGVKKSERKRPVRRTAASEPITGTDAA